MRFDVRNLTFHIRNFKRRIAVEIRHFTFKILTRMFFHYFRKLFEFVFNFLKFFRPAFIKYLFSFYKFSSKPFPNYPKFPKNRFPRIFQVSLKWRYKNLNQFSLNINIFDCRTFGESKRRSRQHRVSQSSDLDEQLSSFHFSK